ncbi:MULTISPECIES: T9SS type B sorting domain-containing protein [unclassified Robiginitalea]|uniref:T9SS type B sorting domain-containing protein n=1 Tax=Robiginitalea TaxID=252306 RepID=UPI00234C02DA|nr:MULTISPECIES: T9SS type B sorting domain-containing protein [unclassified Robiginitalea]MDC6355394.1 T9SS type B sorting domain-containing protein [Robiginitalea sp. PM2]MDC6375391.1 T9SS type B sorting domain-containing protein [Robiginitalea sp. SP8]
MKNYLVLLLGCLLYVPAVTAQNSPDCRSAIPVCADTVRTWFADGGGDIDDFDPDVIRQSGCLEKGSNTSANIENNTSWFVFRAGTGGQIGFDIEALPGASGTVTAEWDFALYGPDVDCADISNGTAQPIRCNYEVNDTNFTGVGINPENGQVGAPHLTGSQNTYDAFLEVQPGEIYYLLINNYNTNFDGDPEPFSLTFTGNSVNTNQDTALDCTLRDEFLGLDITACEGDPDIVLSALNSPAGPDIADIVWSVDYDDDGTIDATLASGPGETELTVSSPDSGRYFVEVTATTSEVYADDILITYYGEPQLDRVDILADLSDSNNIEIIPAGNGDYEYAINGGPFQESPIFNDVPPGINTVVINDRNGCGTTEPTEFLVIGYPKFFTPNADGIHDTWHILGIEELTEPVVFIFDRYGKLLKQIDETSVGWDGNFNGRPLPSSDYWFRLEYSRDEQGVLVANLVRAHFTLKR